MIQFVCGQENFHINNIIFSIFSSKGAKTSQFFLAEGAQGFCHSGCSHGNISTLLASLLYMVSSEIILSQSMLKQFLSLKPVVFITRIADFENLIFALIFLHSL